MMRVTGDATMTHGETGAGGELVTCGVVLI